MEIKIDPSTTGFADRYTEHKKQLLQQYKRILNLVLYVFMYCIALRSLAYTYLGTHSKYDFLLLLSVFICGLYFIIGYVADIIATVQIKKWVFRHDFLNYMRSKLKSRKIQIQ